MRTCPVCDSVIAGRIDKIFCSVKCKSICQYERRQSKEVFYLEVDRQLKTNRKLLKTYSYKGYTTVKKAELINDGFNPNFFTHYWKNKRGDVYLFVYDYGFLDLEKSGKSKYLIVMWQKYMEKKAKF